MTGGGGETETNGDLLSPGGENHHDFAAGHEAATAVHHTQQQDGDVVISRCRPLHFLCFILHPSALRFLALDILCHCLSLLHTARARTHVVHLRKPPTLWKNTAKHKLIMY